MNNYNVLFTSEVPTQLGNCEIDYKKKKRLTV